MSQCVPEVYCHMRVLCVNRDMFRGRAWNAVP